MNIQNALEYSHTLIKTVAGPGQSVIDATMGNGNDTVFLASLVGPTGHVYAFDVQDTAIKNTKEKLILSSQLKQTTLIKDGHEHVDQYVTQDVAAAIFNFGYLPGGDKTVITNAATTITAVQAIMNLLRRGGIICLVVYYGHPGGQDEKQAVEAFVQKLDQHEWTVLNYSFLNQTHTPPKLIALQKR